MPKRYGRIIMAVLSFALVAIPSLMMGNSLEETLTYAVVAPAFNNALFDPVKLSKIILEIEAAWGDSQIMNELSALDIATFNALLTRQNSAKAVLVNPVEDPSKDYEVEVMWPDFCGWEAADCAQDICGTLTGNQRGFKTQGYNLVPCIEDSFEVSETQLAKTSLSLTEYITMNSTRVIKNILTRLNSKAIAFVVANAGYNAGGNYTYDTTTGLTEVPAENFNPELMIDIALDAQLSKVNAPFILDGRLLYKMKRKAELDNDDVSAPDREMNMFPIESDPLGFAKLGIMDRIYLISPSAYAFITKNYVNNATPVYDFELGKYLFNLSLGVFGLKLDAYQQSVCEDSKTGRKKHVFLYRLNYDFIVNPKGCAIDVDGTNRYVNGIIGYKRVA